MLLIDRECSQASPSRAPGLGAVLYFESGSPGWYCSPMTNVSRPSNTSVLFGVYAVALLMLWGVCRFTGVNPFQTQLQSSVLAVLGASIILSLVAVYATGPEDPRLIAVPMVMSLALLMLMMFWIDSTSTPFGWGHPDITSRAAMAQRWALGWIPVDPGVRGSPNWYAPLANLPAVVLIKLGASSTTAVRLVQILVVGAIPWAAWTSCRAVGSRRLAAVYSVSTVVVIGGFGLAKPDEFIAMVVAGPLFVAIQRAFLAAAPRRTMIRLGAALAFLFCLFPLGPAAIFFALVPFALVTSEIRTNLLRVVWSGRWMLLVAGVGLLLTWGPMLVDALQHGIQEVPQQAYWAPRRKISFLDGLEGQVFPLMLSLVVLSALLSANRVAREAWWWVIGFVWLWAFGAAGVPVGVGLQTSRSGQFLPLVLGFAVASAVAVGMDKWKSIDARRVIVTSCAVVSLAAMPDALMFSDEVPEGSRQDRFFVLSRTAPRIDGTYNPFANYRAELEANLSNKPVKALPAATNWNLVAARLERLCGRSVNELVVLPAQHQGGLGWLASWQWAPYAAAWSGPTTNYRARIALAGQALRESTPLDVARVFDSGDFGSVDAVLLDPPSGGMFRTQFAVLNVPEGSVNVHIEFPDALMRYGEVVSGVVIVPLCKSR